MTNYIVFCRSEFFAKTNKLGSERVSGRMNQSSATKRKTIINLSLLVQKTFEQTKTSSLESKGLIKRFKVKKKPLGK